MRLMFMLLSLLAACTGSKREDDAVDQTRTTSAIIVEPTLHDSHAAEPQKATTEPPR